MSFGMILNSHPLHWLILAIQIKKKHITRKVYGIKTKLRNCHKSNVHMYSHVFLADNEFLRRVHVCTYNYYCSLPQFNQKSNILHVMIGSTDIYYQSIKLCQRPVPGLGKQHKTSTTCMYNVPHYTHT